MSERLLKSAEITAALRKHAVPEHLHRGLITYLLDGVRPGGFLMAFLSGDLWRAIDAADDDSIAAFRQLRRFLANEGPAQCYGTLDNVRQWMAKGGLLGQQLAKEDA